MKKYNCMFTKYVIHKYTATIGSDSGLEIEVAVHISK